jgi:plastocyanin
LRLALILTVGLTTCSTSSPDIAPSASTSPSASPSAETSPAPLVRGDLFPVSASPYFTARYSRTVDASGNAALRIAIVGIDGQPAFSPSIVQVEPGQVLKVTVFQSGGLSAQFHHNFSIKSLGIDESLPIGKGNSATVTVTVPASGTLTFFCKYHAAAEEHAGEFRVA